MMDWLCNGTVVTMCTEPVKMWGKQTGVYLMERNLKNQMLIMESFK
jgi:hypothetical protein